MHIGHFNGQIPYTRAPHLHTISPPAWRMTPRHGNHTCDSGGECSSRHDFDEYPPVYLKYAWRGVWGGGGVGGKKTPPPTRPSHRPKDVRAGLRARAPPPIGCNVTSQTRNNLNKWQLWMNAAFFCLKTAKKSGDGASGNPCAVTFRNAGSCNSRAGDVLPP